MRVIVRNWNVFHGNAGPTRRRGYLRETVCDVRARTARTCCACRRCPCGQCRASPGPGIDHVLVRGAAAGPLVTWPRERRVHNGVVLSDHAPVELGVQVTFEQARAEFPVLERIAYLNAGTFGPLARGTVDAMRAEQERDFAEGRSGDSYFQRTLALRAELRGEIAALVGADPSQVALTSSTTDACNIVLAGLGLAAGDEVVTTSAEHFGLLGPLGASAARVVVTEPDPERILAAVTPRTRLLAVSQVVWTTGRMLPVKELREHSGVPVLVDGAQSVGAVPVEAAGLDFLTVSGQKWLCGPDTTGALVVADPDGLRVAAPSYFSQQGYAPDGTFTPREGAPRFEPNWWPAASLSGLRAALRGRPEWAFERAAVTAERCRSLLSPLVDVVVPEQRSTLVSFRPAGEPEALVARLADRGVHVREIPGAGLVRASCGWWTSESDLERLVAGLS